MNRVAFPSQRHLLSFSQRRISICSLVMDFWIGECNPENIDTMLTSFSLIFHITTTPSLNTKYSRISLLIIYSGLGTTWIASSQSEIQRIQLHIRKLINTNKPLSTKVILYLWLRVDSAMEFKLKFSANTIALTFGSFESSWKLTYFNSLLN